MKKVTLIIPFVFAFLFVTGMLVYLNTIYNNIFQFDFSPRSEEQVAAAVDSLSVKDSINVSNQKPEIELAANKNLEDTVTTNDNLDNIAQAESEVKIDNPLTSTEQNSKALNVNEKTNKDSAYNAWLKKTVKLVENLSPAQASKLLMNYPDNQVRDIIYAMKQKQAAKIISYLEPEYVHKLTRFE